MNCPQCGAAVTERYCPSCGTEVTASGPTDETTGLVLASFGVRAAATIVDFLVLLIPEAALRFLLGNAIGLSAFVVIFGFYLVLQWSRCDGRSVGNRVAHSRIVNADDGRSVSTYQAFNRYLYLEIYAFVDIFGALGGANTIVLVALVYGLVDNLFALFDRRNQTLHDKFARTIVVMTD